MSNNFMGFEPVDEKSFMYNGKLIEAGQTFLRQGDMYVKFVRWATGVERLLEQAYRVIDMQAMIVGRGELMGHIHQLRPSTELDTRVPEDGHVANQGFNWLQTAAQEVSGFLESFNNAQVAPNTVVTLVTYPGGVWLFHEGDNTTAGSQDIADHTHTPVWIPGDMVVEIYRQRVATIDASIDWSRD